MRVVLCNCPPDAAPALAKALVDAGLAACVNLIPGVTSVYRWEGELVEDSETTLLIKVPITKVAALRSAIVDRHPYDVPEIVVLAVDVDQSHQPYVKWVRQTHTRDDAGEP